jgi:hypothetical protein
MQTSAKIHLCAFADGPFSTKKRKFLAEADALNIFHKISFFDCSTLPFSFLEQHDHFMRRQQRGFGYWIWKPLVIELALEASSPGDIVVYLDAGFTLNAGGRNRFLEYIDITLDSPDKMLSFQNIHTEYRWTKADLAQRLGVLQRPSIMATSQLSSGFILLGKTSSNASLIREWRQISVENNYHYSDDTNSIAPNHPEFVEHRHDQSISSLLRKIRGTEVSHYEVQSYAPYFDSLKSRLPALATRSRT